MCPDFAGCMVGSFQYAEMDIVSLVIFFLVNRFWKTASKIKPTNIKMVQFTVQYYNYIESKIY